MSGKEEKGSADLSNFIDKHLRELRWMSYGLGAVAAIIIIRNLRATKKFVTIHQIPSEFITNSYTLQGHVRHITDVGVLHIEHTPIIELPWLSNVLKASGDQSLYLNILPAGLDLNADAVLWLKDHAAGKHAWFQMFERDEQALYCDIRIKKGYFGRVSISNHLIAQSLCKVQDFQSPPDGEYFHDYLRHLIALEHKASKKGKGIWKDEKENWLKRNYSNVYVWCRAKVRRLFKRNSD